MSHEFPLWPKHKFDRTFAKIFAEIDECNSKSVKIHSVHIQQIHRDARISAETWLRRVKDIKAYNEKRWA